MEKVALERSLGLHFGSVLGAKLGHVGHQVGLKWFLNMTPKNSLKNRAASSRGKQQVAGENSLLAPNKSIKSTQGSTHGTHLTHFDPFDQFTS